MSKKYCEVDRLNDADHTEIYPVERDIGQSVRVHHTTAMATGYKLY